MVRLLKTALIVSTLLLPQILFSSEVERLRVAADNLETLLVEAGANESLRIDSAVLDALWLPLKEELEYMMFWDLHAFRLKQEMIDESYQRLKDRVYWLTPELFEKLGLKKHVCEIRNGEEQCTFLKAFYIPLVNKIFINQNVSPEHLLFALYHELVHAYQYTFRFPSDIVTLSEVREGRRNRGDRIVQDSERFEFLNYYYESQANWYEMLFGVKTKLEPYHSWRLRGEVPVRGKAVAQQFGRATLGVLGIGNFVGNYRKLLPNVDMLFADIIVGGKGGGWTLGPTAFLLQEPVTLGESNTGTIRRINSNIDIELHTHFHERLIQTYYGDLGFTFQSNAADQHVFKKLSDRFFDNVNNIIDCKRQLIRSSESPLVQWLTLPTDEFNKCSDLEINVRKKDLNILEKGSFETFSSRQFRDQIIKQLLDDLKSDPFHIHPGSEGTKGGYSIYPQLELTP